MHSKVDKGGSGLTSVVLKSCKIATALVLVFSASVNAQEAAEPVFDAKGNLVQSSTDGETVVQSEYDENGNLIRERFADGRIVNYDAETGAVLD